MAITVFYDNILLSSSSTTSPFTYTVDTGYFDIPAAAKTAGQRVYFKIRNKLNKSEYANVIGTVSGLVLTVVETLKSSSADTTKQHGYALPTFTGDVEVYSYDIASELTPLIHGGMGMLAAVGQSNIVGFDYNRLKRDLDYDESMIYQLASAGSVGDTQSITENTVIAAVEPLKWPSWTDTGIVPANTNSCAMAMARKLLVNNGRKKPILMAPSAVGSTGYSTDNWNIGNPEETAARTKINAGFAASPYNSLDYIFFGVGEDDAQVSSNTNDIDTDTAIESFRYRILYMLDQWRRADGAWIKPEANGSLVQTNADMQFVPTLFMRIPPESAAASAARSRVDTIISTLNSYRAYTGIVDTTSPTNLPSRTTARGSTVDDVLHLTAVGQRAAGQRAADTALPAALANTTNPTPAVPGTVTGSGNSNTEITATDLADTGKIRVEWHLRGADYPLAHTIQTQYTLSTDTGWASPIATINTLIHGHLDHNPATAYVIDDKTHLDGVIYKCILGHTNQTPPNATYWVVSSLTTREAAGYTNVTITGLTDGVAYRARCKAVNTVGTSAAWSNEVVQTPTAGAGAPATLIRLRKNVGLINDSDVAATGTDPIKVWQDQSGNNHHAEQSSGFNQGVRVNTGNNVGAVGLTTGTNSDWYIFNKQGLSNWNGDKTFIIQFTPTAGTSRILFSTRDSATGNTHGMTIWFNGTANTIECFGNGGGSVTLNNGGSTSKQWLGVTVASGGTVNMYWNTANTVTGDTTATGSITETTGKDQLTLAKYKLLDNGLDGSVCHIDVDNTVLTQSQIHSIVSNHYDAS